MTRARTATATDSGRACPYCRFALKQGAAVIDCPGCASTHHDECWTDNGGCAVMGCAAAPGVPATSAAGPGSGPRLPPPPPVFPPPDRSPGGPPAPPGRRGVPALTGAVLLLALALAGTAVAIAVSSKDAPPATVVVPPPASSTSAAPPAAPPGDDGGSVPVAETVDSADIQPVLQAYYGAVRAGDFNRAWDLLSRTYKTWKASNGGFEKWQQQESRNRAHLRVGEVGVKVRSFDASSGVATIFVSGMRFERRDGTLCAYEGITWARRTAGTWRYDQGYLQNQARAATWRARSQETLGVACDESGY